MSLFCKHDDELIDKTVLLSAFEQALKEDAKELTNMPHSALQGKVIHILKCKKCKRVKKLVETNP